MRFLISAKIAISIRWLRGGARHAFYRLVYRLMLDFNPLAPRRSQTGAVFGICGKTIISIRWLRGGARPGTLITSPVIGYFNPLAPRRSQTREVGAAHSSQRFQSAGSAEEPDRSNGSRRLQVSISIRWLRGGARLTWSNWRPMTAKFQSAGSAEEPDEIIFRHAQHAETISIRWLRGGARRPAERRQESNQISIRWLRGGARPVVVPRRTTIITFQSAGSAEEPDTGNRVSKIEHTDFNPLAPRRSQTVRRRGS